MLNALKANLERGKAWVFQDKHKEKVQKTYEEVEKAFTEHPHETGETYFQHLWFTVKMGLRFIYVSVVLILHGLFPFIFVKTASSQIERIYRIMKSRIPKHRRDEIDAQDYTHGEGI